MFFNKIHVRMKIVFIVVIIILLLIIGKVFYIEVFSNEKLKKLSNDLYSRELPISASRGEILDRNGKVLATNITSATLILVPRQIINKEDTAKKLSEILNVPYQDMLKHVNKNTSIERVHPEGRNLSYEIADKINSLNIDGVYLVKESKRYYPYDNLLSHTLGYVGIDNQGLSGLELEYNDYLTGTDGKIKYYSNGKGQRLLLPESYEMPTSGMSISLTIDIELQRAIENELDNIITKYTPDNALIIVQNPNTGEILASASKPDFNPNSYQNASTEVINRNLPIWKTYEPGSTFKIITLAASLEEKKIDLFTDTFTDTGAIKVEDSTLHCWKHGGHGLQTYLEVVENSCNLLVNTGTHLNL